MDEKSLREEITEHWAALPGTPRYVAADMLITLSLIAWRELAHPASADEMVIVRDIAEQVGSRSEKPRTVLRKLIEFVEREYLWSATPSVLRAAGKKAAA